MAKLDVVCGGCGVHFVGEVDSNELKNTLWCGSCKAWAFTATVNADGTTTTAPKKPTLLDHLHRAGFQTVHIVVICFFVFLALLMLSDKVFKWTGQKAYPSASQVDAHNLKVRACVSARKCIDECPKTDVIISGCMTKCAYDAFVVIVPESLNELPTQSQREGAAFRLLWEWCY